MRYLLLLLLCSVASAQTYPLYYNKGTVPPAGSIYVVGYGAKCDGTTDDLTAFQRAASAIPASGGTIIIPSQNCVIGGLITLKSHTHILGDGSTLTAKTASMPWTGCCSAGNSNMFINANAATDITIEGINFVYPTTGAGATASHILQFDSTASNIKILNNTSTGSGDFLATVGTSQVYSAGNNMQNVSNACLDHWGGATDVVDIGNYCTTYVQSANSVGALSFTGIDTAGAGSATIGYSAIGNTIYMNETNFSATASWAGPTSTIVTTTVTAGTPVIGMPISSPQNGLAPGTRLSNFSGSSPTYTLTLSTPTSSDTNTGATLNGGQQGQGIVVNGLKGTCNYPTVSDHRVVIADNRIVVNSSAAAWGILTNGCAGNEDIHDNICEGGVGAYACVGATGGSFTGTISGTTLTFPSLTGYIAKGMTVSGTGVSAGTIITAIPVWPDTASYTVNNSQTVGPVSMTVTAISNVNIHDNLAYSWTNTRSGIFVNGGTTGSLTHNAAYSSSSPLLGYTGSGVVTGGNDSGTGTYIIPSPVSATNTLAIGGGTVAAAAAWLQVGPLFHVLPTTLTDSSSSGTIASEVIDTIGSGTLKASSATTVTNLANLYVDAPIASTNVTATNKYSIMTASNAGIYSPASNSLFAGLTDLGTTVINSSGSANTTIGNPSSTFTMNAGTVAGTGWALLPAITTASQFTSTIATGTAPFVVASTTNVANLNASLLNGTTFAAPAALGSGTPAAVTGTTVTATTNFVHGVTVLCQVSSATGTTHTGDTAETNLASCTVPAGIMGTQGMLRVTSLWSRTATTTNTVNLIVRFSATQNSTSAGSALTQAVSTSSVVAASLLHQIRNTSASAQILYGVYGTPFATTLTSAVATLAVNTANASYVNFSCTDVTSSADTCGIYAYTVELVSP